MKPAGNQSGRCFLMGPDCPESSLVSWGLQLALFQLSSKLNVIIKVRSVLRMGGLCASLTVKTSTFFPVLVLQLPFCKSK